MNGFTIDFDKITYNVEAIGYKITGDHTEFIFKLTTVNDI